MRKMKKYLSLLLAIVFVFGAVRLPAFAAEEAVIFADNFDSAAEGTKPKVIGVVENEGKKLLIRVAREDENGYVYMRCEEGGTAGAPRMQISFDATQYSSVTLTYRAKGIDASAAVTYTTDGGAAGMSTTLAGVDDTKWTDVKLVLNLEKMTYTRWVNGQENLTDRSLHAPMDATKSEFRFSGSQLQPGQGVCFDDIEVRGVVSQNKAAQKPTEAPTEVPFEPKTTPKAVSVPAGAHTFLNTDFANVDTGLAAQASIFDGGTAYSEIMDVGKNRLVRYWATDGQKHQPRLIVSLPEGVDTYVIEYVAQMSATAETYVSLYADGKNNATLAGATAKNSLFREGDWNYFKIEVDLKNLVAKSTLNGEVLSERQLNPIENRGSVNVWFCAGLGVGDVVYADNFVVYTKEEYKFQGIIKGKNEIVWENVVPTAPLSENSYTANLVSHPRIFVHDWDAMREKVNATYETKIWYANLKQKADQYLNDKATYNVNSRGNVLESAREAELRLQTLAFVYKIDGDKKYLNKALAEMREYGTWPDWSGFVSALVTAEIVFGYACAYDWLYDDLTAAERDEIRAIVKKLGLPEFIYTYERKATSASYTSGDINWNPVCNTATIATAFAFASEEPQLAEYILERAPGFIVNALPPYAPQGAYPEGTTYWAYGTQFLCYAMDLLEYGFKDGFNLPEKYKYYTYPGIADTAEFAIYYNGTAGKFDYGDSDSYLTSSGAFYWMANRFNKPQYAWYQNKLQRDRNSYLGGLSAIFALASYDENNATVAPGAFGLDKFYTDPKGVNGMSMRTTWDGKSGIFAAMQGGDNAANHMHYSLGTFVIDYRGQRFVDEEITTDYALKNPHEEIYYYRAEGHNTLIANPTAAADQSPTAIAALVATGSSENTAFGILDMTQTNKDYVSAKRGMMLTDNRSRVVIQDEVTAKKPSEFYWFANTEANVRIAADGKSAILENAGERMLVRIVKAPAEAKLTIMDRSSVVDGVLNTQKGSKLAIHLTDVTDLNLAVEYIGLREGEGIPAPSVYVPLANWTAQSGSMRATAMAGSATVLKLGSPNAIAGGEKTFVDTTNTEVVPFTENGRTLVPVRFIAESFGAKVGWDDVTQSVTVNYLDKDIRLAIGSNEMKVNGETVLLDVPANTYNSRTLIPLRALVEALGKTVHWDDRGLIIIAEDSAPYSAEAIDKLIAQLDIRVRVNGKDLAFFDVDRTDYVLTTADGTAHIDAVSGGTQVVSVSQADGATIVSVDGKNYTFRTQSDAFATLAGHKDPGVLSAIELSMKGAVLPEYDTFIYVERLTDSTGFASYPERGIVDGVINSETENRWASNGDGQWIQMDFGSEKTLCSMAFAGVNQTSRAYNFDVLVSNDGVTYKTVHTGGAPTTEDKMSIIPLGDVSARYVKLLCHGSNQGTWNTYAEVRFYESAAQQAEDVSYWGAYFEEKDIRGAAGTQAKLHISGSDAQRGKVSVRADAIVTYKVADSSVATVSADGTVQFIKAGKTTVTAIVMQDGFTVRASAEVTVE